MSYWKKCDMCHIRYDIIGKMETFYKDSRYVVNKANITLLMPLPEEKHHVSKVHEGVKNFSSIETNNANEGENQVVDTESSMDDILEQELELINDNYIAKALHKGQKMPEKNEVDRSWQGL